MNMDSRMTVEPFHRTSMKRDRLRPRYFTVKWPNGHHPYRLCQCLVFQSQSSFMVTRGKQGCDIGWQCLLVGAILLVGEVWPVIPMSSGVQHPGITFEVRYVSGKLVEEVSGREYCWRCAD